MFYKLYIRDIDVSSKTGLYNCLSSLGSSPFLYIIIVTPFLYIIIVPPFLYISRAYWLTPFLYIIERELASRADQRVLRCFGHMERMDEYRIFRRVLIAEVNGRRVRGRPRLGWLDGVEMTLGNTGMTVEAVRKSGKPLVDRG